MNRVAIPIPAPEDLTVIASDGEVWVAVPITREFLIGTHDVGPFLLELVDEHLERMHQRRDRAVIGDLRAAKQKLIDTSTMTELDLTPAIEAGQRAARSYLQALYGPEPQPLSARERDLTEAAVNAAVEVLRPQIERAALEAAWQIVRDDALECRRLAKDAAERRDDGDENAAMHVSRFAAQATALEHVGRKLAARVGTETTGGWK